MLVREWESLAAALSRLLLGGLNGSEAKADLCYAIANRKIDVRAHCTNGCMLKGNDIDVPTLLNPEDFDWPQSQPRKPWQSRPTVADHYETRNVMIDVSLVELRTEDVTRVLGFRTDTAVASTGSNDRQATPATVADDALSPDGRVPPGFHTLREPWTYYQAVAFLAYGSTEVAARYGGPDNARDGGHHRRGCDLFYPKSSGLPGTEALKGLYGNDLIAATAAWEAADADRWRAAVAKHYQAMLSGSVTAYRGTAAYGLCGLIDPAPAGAWARRLSGAEGCRFLPAELMSLIEGRAAGHATTGVAAEPLRASAGRPVAQEPGSPPNWKPLIDALEWADSALGADAWGLMMEWNQSDELPMRGRADGRTQAFQCHWFDYPAWWGPAADADGEIPSSDRPRRTRPDPAMANRLAPRPSRSIKDDILWFDQSAARAKGVDVPNRVSNILVEMTALRRLVREWSEQNIFRDVSEARTAEAEAGQMEVDVLPNGCLFIDTAVEQIRERLRISEGPALKRLLDIMHTGEVRTWKKRSRDIREKVRPGAWEGAHVDLDIFRARGHSGIVFCGSHYHLHRFLISEEDLACWLLRAAPMTQAEIEPPGVAAAAVPADAPVLRKAAEPVAELIGIEPAPAAPREAQEGDRQRCPWKQEDFEKARDRLPLLVEWAKWKYGAGPFPSRGRILDDHRSAFGQVLGISEPLIRQLLRKIAPDRKGGAPAHRDSPGA